MSNDPPSTKLPGRKTDDYILEYLLANLLNALLQEWHAFRDSENPANPRSTEEIEQELETLCGFSDRNIFITNAFLKIHSTLHPSKLPRDLAFRLLLTRFLTLLIRGLDLSTSLSPDAQTEAINRLRHLDRTRATRWLSRRTTSPHIPPTWTTPSDLTALYLRYPPLGRTLPSISTPPLSHHQRYRGPGLLSDALPLYVKIGGWVTAHLTEASPMWLQTLLLFMEFSFAEKYLLPTSSTNPLSLSERLWDAINTSFSFGPTPITPSIAEEISPTELITNDLFCDEDGEIADVFEAAKREKVAGLREKGEGGLPGSGEEWWEKRRAFEEKVVRGFVEAVGDALGDGVLGELERGEGWIEGVSVEEVLRRAGVVVPGL